MKPDRPVPALHENLALLVAAALPPGIYAQIPGTGLSLGQIAGVAFVFAALFLAVRYRRFRPPFEYWWIAAAFVPLAGLLAMSGASEAAAACLAGAALFLAVVVVVQRRELAADGLLVIAVMCGIVAVLNLLAQHGQIPPAAIDGEAGIAVAVGESVRASALLVVTGLLAALYVLGAGAPGAARRALAGVALLPILFWIGTIGRHVPLLPAQWAPVSLPDLSATGACALLLLLWLIARVMARAIRAARCPGDWLPPLLLLAGTLAHAWAGRPPGAVAVVALGLVAAAGAPWAVSGAARFPRWPALPVVACLLIQVSGVIPLSAGDPRNQLARGERLLDEKRWHALDGHLDFLLARHPGHPGYSLLRATSLLERGWPHAAVAQFRGAAVPARGTATHHAQQAFLDALRDAASARTPARRGLLFERALIHAGEVESALDSLVIRRRAAPPPYAGERAPLAAAAALLLGEADLAGQFGGWDAAQLHALLEDSGVAVETAPAGLPGAEYPLIVEAAVHPDGLRSSYLRPGGATGDVHFRAGESRAQGGVQLAWQQWREGPDGSWALPLAAGHDEVLVVRVSGDGRISAEPHSNALPEEESVAVAVFVP